MAPTSRSVRQQDPLTKTVAERQLPTATGMSSEVDLSSVEAADGTRDPKP